MQIRLALVGFGEAGSTFAHAAAWGGQAIAHDIDPLREAMMAQCGVVCAQSAAEAVGAAPLILSLVTADRAEQAARDYARFIAPGAIWCDMNSVAPQTKQATAQAIAAAGGHYVDVAVLAPVNPAGMAVPLLLAGEAAGRAESLLQAAGFTNTRVVGGQVGRASTIKMIRSVMVKGLEALTAEMMIAAQAAGVRDEVLASLDASERAQPWAVRADYNLDRMLLHGRRRAAEMRESAQTLEDLGIAPMMTQNTVQWQDKLGGLTQGAVPDGLDAKLAAILAAAFSGDKGSHDDDH